MIINWKIIPESCHRIKGVGIVLVECIGIRYKLGKLTDHELEKLSEICRFKNTKTNLSEMARHLGVSPDTVKDELQRRGIYKKLMDLKKAK